MVPAMKVTPEDMDRIRDAINMTMAEPHRYEERDIALACLLYGIYDRGYNAAMDDIRNDLSDWDRK